MLNNYQCLVGDIPGEITAYMALFGAERLQEHVRFGVPCSFWRGFWRKTSYIKSVRRPGGWDGARLLIVKLFQFTSCALVSV